MEARFVSSSRLSSVTSRASDSSQLSTQWNNARKAFSKTRSSNNDPTDRRDFVNATKEAVKELAMRGTRGAPTPSTAQMELAMEPRWAEMELSELLVS